MTDSDVLLEAELEVVRRKDCPGASGTDVADDVICAAGPGPGREDRPNTCKVDFTKISKLKKIDPQSTVHCK